MVKLKVSYEEVEELTQLITHLGDMVRKVKLAEQKGKYKRAYIEVTEPKKC